MWTFLPSSFCLMLCGLSFFCFKGHHGILNSPAPPPGRWHSWNHGPWPVGTFPRTAHWQWSWSYHPESTPSLSALGDYEKNEFRWKSYELIVWHSKGLTQIMQLPNKIHRSLSICMCNTYLENHWSNSHLACVLFRAGGSAVLINTLWIKHDQRSIAAAAETHQRNWHCRSR